MTDQHYVSAMQSISLAETAISRAWVGADGPARARLLHASNLLEQARAEIKLAREAAAKAAPPEESE